MAVMRMYGDPVEVRPRSDQADEPAAFLWRGRLYVVRDVLGHWRERSSWWSSPAARLVHGVGEGAPDHTEPSEPSHAHVRVADLAEEREVWRVNASPGRAYAGGVYELSREPVGASTASRGSPGHVWHLVRVAD
jgi:hypothetical protein